MAEPAVRLDLRAVLPIAALAVVVLVIIGTELCGREDVKPLAQAPTSEFPTSTPGEEPTLAPGQPSATPVAPTATAAPRPGAEERDLQRSQDLKAIADALEIYRGDHGSYPSSGGNVQTFCVFEDSDAGCKVREVLSTLPADPLGDPLTENGYWYASSGDRFAVYAQRETDRLAECPAQKPDFLDFLDSIFCEQGPPPTEPASP